MYAVLDLESTGGNLSDEAITEVAIYKFDGREIVDQYGSLVNPDRKIQPYVVQLTGINNDMLRYAPKFHQVAKRIVEITEDCTLVAHNVKFDYRLLRTEFKRLGYDYKRKTLDTVELSQNLIPNMPSYSLGKLVKGLGIPITNRHRAFGDAMATLRLFKLLLSKDTGKNIIGTAVQRIKPAPSKQIYLQILDQLPSEIGVYYIYNAKNEIIYLNKSRNIRHRVNRHFTSDSLMNKLIQKEVQNVTYELTGNKLIAGLREYEEIKKIKPKYNPPFSPASFAFGLYRETNQKGQAVLRFQSLDPKKESITVFRNVNQAQLFLRKIINKYNLNTDLIEIEAGLTESLKTLLKRFSHTQNTAQNAEEHKAKLTRLTEDYGLEEDTVLLVGPGRHPAEKSVLFLKNKLFKGIAYVDLNHQLNHLKMIEHLLIPMENTEFAKNMIKNYLQKDIYRKKAVNR